MRATYFFRTGEESGLYFPGYRKAEAVPFSEILGNQRPYLFPFRKCRREFRARRKAGSRFGFRVLVIEPALHELKARALDRDIPCGDLSEFHVIHFD